MKRLYTSFFAAAALLLSTNAAADFDSSEYFQNLDFESCTMVSGGWASSVDGWSQNWALKNCWVYNSSSSDCGDAANYLSGSNFYYAYVGANVTSTGAFCSQSATVPVGKYKVTAEIMLAGSGDSNNDFYIFAGDDQCAVTKTGYGYVYDYSVVTTVEDDDNDGYGTLTIGFGVNAITYSSWIGFYVGEVTVELADDDESNDGFRNLDFAGGTGAWNTYINYTSTSSADYHGSFGPSATSGVASTIDGNYVSLWVNEGESLSAGTLISQSTNVAAGTYKVTADVYSSVAGLVLYANNQTTEISASNSWDSTEAPYVIVTLEADGELEIGLKTTSDIDGEINVYFDNFAVTAYTESESGANAVAEIASDAAEIVAIYNVVGARTTQLGRGVNIVKFADGSVKKILVK